MLRLRIGEEILQQCWQLLEAVYVVAEELNRVDYGSLQCAEGIESEGRGEVRREAKVKGVEANEEWVTDVFARPAALEAGISHPTHVTRL